MSVTEQTKTDKVRQSMLLCRSNVVSGSGGIYRPEELMLLRRIFEEALRTIPVKLRTASNQSQIVKRLLDCAATGERNPVELRLAALAGLNVSRVKDKAA